MEVTVMWMLLILGLCSRATASCTKTAKDITESSGDVSCPAGCQTNGAKVWGTDVYTEDSSICRAAIHAGVISKDGGKVTVQKTSGQSSYSGSTRNGITTIDYKSWPKSFVFVTSTPAATASCTKTAKDITESSGDVSCPAGCQTNGAKVWGTDVYTEDSSICRAAMHAGVISKDGGKVTVQKTSGQSSYSGSTRNGITTIDYKSWPKSFIFVTSTPAETASCTTTAKDMKSEFVHFVCPAECQTNGGKVWGSGVYTEDSPICKAAIHAGIIPNKGGQVTVQKGPGQESYDGSTRNGITTSSYGPWTGSFIFNNCAIQVTQEVLGAITQRPSVMADTKIHIPIIQLHHLIFDNWKHYDIENYQHWFMTDPNFYQIIPLPKSNQTHIDLC